MAVSIQGNFGQQYFEELPTLGDSLGELLAFFGVQRLYGVGGDFVANLINALESHVDILPSSNEMHAGFSACGQAELNALGVCMSTYTVGSLPCTSAAALAVTEGLPVVFLSGAPAEAEINGHALHHSIHPHTAWHTDLDAALNAFKAIGVRSERIQGQRHSGQPNVAAEQFFELLQYAYLNRQPVYIEIPRDLILQKTQAIMLPENPSILQQQVSHNLHGAELIAEQIAMQLTAAKAPLVFIGEKLRSNISLLQQIVEFCHRLQLPYATSWFGKGMLDEQHPLCLGCYNGAFSQLVNQEYIESQADYVLELGTAIFPSDTNNAFGSGTHVIDSHKNKTMLKGTSKWDADIQAVLKVLQQMTLAPKEQSLAVVAADSESTNEHASYDDAPMGYHRLAQCINQAQVRAGQPFIFLPEVGNSLFASFELDCGASDIGRSYLANPWYAAMGTSLPYARAVADQLADVGSAQPIVVLTGDGGFNFQSNELISLQKQNANVVIVYMRNNIFHLGKAGDAPIYACNHEGFDPKILVQAYGGEGHQCRVVSEFVTALISATQQGGLHLIEVITSTDLEMQCDATRKLNTYIGFRNGNVEATKSWHKLCGQS